MFSPIFLNMDFLTSGLGGRSLLFPRLALLWPFTIHWVDGVKVHLSNRAPLLDFCKTKGKWEYQTVREGLQNWKINLLLPPCIHPVTNVGTMTGEYRLSLEAIINATLMAHGNSKAPAQEQAESA